MRLRSSIALVATTALFIAACSPAATPKPTATAAAPTPTAAAATPTAVSATPTAVSATPTAVAATPTAVPATGTPAASAWKIGVVTDVGTIDDKNFNQYSYEGAQQGAAAVGTTGTVPYFVPADSSQYKSGIQGFLDQGFNVIVTVGFNLTLDTENAAIANPTVHFIAVDQAPCLNADGTPNPAGFPCDGDPLTVIPNFIGLQYQEDQAGYLAGIVAASISTTHNIGAIGGINLVPAVVRYIQGYEMGAKSVDPTITFNSGYVSTSDFGVAFNNPGEGKTFATQFINTKHPDVLFQVAGKTGNGVLEAACAAGIHGIGVDVDQWLSLNADATPAYQCIVTSAEKHLATSVQQTIEAIAAGTATPGSGGVLHFDATNDGIGYSAEQDGAGLITTAIQGLLDTALAGMKDGSITTCPANCGQP